MQPWSPPDGPQYPPSHLGRSPQGSQQPVVITMRRSRPSGMVVTLVLVLLLAAAGGGWWLTHSASMTNGRGEQALSQPRAASPAQRGNNLAAVATPVTFRSARGHFVAAFAARPLTQSTVEHYGRFTIHSYTAADRVSRSSVISVDFTPAVPSNETEGVLAGMANGAGTGLHATVLDTRNARFRGHRAVTVDFVVPDGTRVKLVGVLWSAHRTFLVQAPAGARLTRLEHSFKVLR